MTYFSGLIPCPLPAGDYRYAAAAPEGPADWARTVMLALPRVEDQGRLNSCTGHAGTSAAEALDPACPQLSRRWLWEEAKRLSGMHDNAGAYLYQMCNVLIGGVPSEDDAPYDGWDPKDRSYPDTLTKYDPVRAHQLLTGDLATATWHALDAGQPVVIGVAANAAEFYAGWDAGHLVAPTTRKPINFYHAMCVVGWMADWQQFVIINSWGPGAVGDGRVYASRADYNALVYEARALVPERVTPLPKPDPTSERAARIDEVQRAIAADYADWLDLDTQSQQRGDESSPDYDPVARDLLAFKRDGVGNAWRRGQDRLAELVRDGA